MFRITLGAWCLAWMASGAFAQTYPNRISKLQVPFAPGGTTDIIARTIADPLNKILGRRAPAVRKRIEDTGSFGVGNTPEQFAEQIKAEYGVYEKVVDNAKLTLE